MCYDEPPFHRRYYSLIRSESGGEVYIRSYGEQVTLTPGQCSCGQPDCHHKAIINAIAPKWNPFAPRQYRYNRYVLPSAEHLRHSFDNLLSNLTSALPLLSYSSLVDALRMREADMSGGITKHRYHLFYPGQIVRKCVSVLQMALENGAQGDEAINHLTKSNVFDVVSTLAKNIAAESRRGNLEQADYQLALWHELLRAYGVDSPVLPTHISRCGRCRSLTELGGTCPKCLREILEGAVTSKNSFDFGSGYLADVYEELKGSGVEWWVGATATRLTQALRRDSDVLWRAAVRDWHYFTCGLHQLPSAFQRCPRCAAPVRADGSCPCNNEAKSLDATTRLCREYLRRNPSDYLSPDDIQSFQLVGDEDGISGAVVSLSNHTYELTYRPSTGSWTLAPGQALLELPPHGWRVWKPVDRDQKVLTLLGCVADPLVRHSGLLDSTSQ